MNLIQLENVTKTYRLGKTEVRALKQFNLTVEKGEFLSLAGPSGSGKSTILNLVGILDRPSSGRVLLEGEDIAGMTDHQRARLRLSHVGFIFQSFNLLPVLTVHENVEYPLILMKLPLRERTRRVTEALEAVGLGDRARHKPDELSGGQRQRVAIGRALVTQPHIVLADEPTANLDSKTGEEVLNLMETLNKEKQVTFVFASHDPNIIKRAKRVVKIHDGERV
jgi:putative ABC transport system ATP-binding protein